MVPALVVAAVIDLAPIVVGLGVTPRERYAVRVAIESGDIHKVDAFIDRAPGRLNAPLIGVSNSLLSLAAESRQRRLAEHLRARGARIDMPSAARLGWDDEIRRIAKADPRAVRRREGDGIPLQPAVWRRNVSTVRLLVELGSPLRLPQTDHYNSWDILQDVVALGPDIVEFILARSSAADLKEVWAGVFEQACGAPPAGQDDAATARTLRLLLDRRPRTWDPGRFLRTACLYGNVPAVKLLLAAGADPTGASPPDPSRLPTIFAAVAQDLVVLSRTINPQKVEGLDPPPLVDQREIEVGVRELHRSLPRLVPFFSGGSVLTDAEEARLPALDLVAVSDHIRHVRVRVEIAELLVRAGANWTFRAAVGIGRADLVKQFLATDPGLAKSEVYRCRFYLAGWRYGPRVYDRRPRPKNATESSIYPLEVAAERGDVATVRLLLPLDQPGPQEGAGAVAVRALRVAVERGHHSIVEAILANPRHTAVLKPNLADIFSAAGRVGSVPVLEALAAFQPPTKAEATAAIVAASGAGRLAAAKRASTLGGDPTEGGAALYAAAGQGHVDVVRWLLAERADPNQPVGDGYRPLHAAAVRDFAHCVEALLAAKADPNLTANGSTPLMLAANTDGVAAIKALTAAGADLRAKDSVGNTALHAAAASGSVRAARELLRLGADPAAKNTAGQTPLDLIGRYRQSKEYAKFERWDEIEVLLRAAGPKK